MTQDVYLAGATRTAIGTFCGMFEQTPAPVLGSAAVRAALQRAGVSPDCVDEVIFGNVIGAGLGQNVARQVAIGAGLSPSIGGTTVNKVCGSGLKSVMLAAQAIQCGDAQVVVAGGTENMSRAPYLLEKARGGYRMGNGEIIDSMIRDGLWDVYNQTHMGTCGDRCAEKYGLTREQQDEFAVASFKRAIEAAANPADESWHNINAIDDVCLEIMSFTDKIVISALRANGGAGGVFLALAADEVWARNGVVLNPHYKNMGNLYGSEYWTYLLPRRVGADGAARIMGNRLPIGARAAARAGLVDAVLEGDSSRFVEQVVERSLQLATAENYPGQLAARNARRDADLASRPLAAYRAAELERMRLNFYGFDPSYHVARHRFVHRTPHSWTPRHLAAHRRL